MGMRHPWYRSASGLAVIVGGVVFLVAMVAVVLLTISMLESGVFIRPPQPFVSSADATNQAFTSSIDAAATANAALAAEEPQPTRVSGPHLGAPLSDFDAAFGPEHSQGVWYVTLNGQPVMLTVQTNTMGAHNAITTPDGLDRVWTLRVDYLGPAPSNTQNVAICKQFMPGDALHMSDNADSPTHEHIYRSQILAASFDPNAFQNNTGADVAPGTFDVLYTARSCSMNTRWE
jgi:hypothetical protein